ncbi:uncharacterized protein EV154DRAFT_502693 [Mucor mucedo]|uniref:uncharacterized protein n=1 Tax=Mucor mucedo TaxID=29922 RepID=UPI00221F03F2|nr:uncharacterized protein EV154DRAFT_502693 [Mucor mucedo]KAI7893173.1 hypothetical protein EV154DRAFT_502693 [Mucor mucedo]
MPFRCKCGRTFEKTDSFASHTSACAPFHQRRMSDTTQQVSLTGFLSSPSLSPAQSDSSTISSSSSSDLSSSVPTTTGNGFFMPTALSLHNVFEGARRRSMSSSSSTLK